MKEKIRSKRTYYKFDVWVWTEWSAYADEVETYVVYSEKQLEQSTKYSWDYGRYTTPKHFRFKNSEYGIQRVIGDILREVKHNHKKKLADFKPFELQHEIPPYNKKDVNPEYIAGKQKWIAFMEKKDGGEIA